MLNLPIDHLLYGVPNLEDGIAHIHQLTGVKPAIGGSHPGLGTHNALLALGDSSYLEIIAPDPNQTVERVWMDLDKLQRPRLFRWAVARGSLEEVRAKVLSLGVDIGEILKGQRQTTDGHLLQWALSDPNVILADGLIPFLIDWGKQGNPTPTLPKGCELKSLTATHPNPSVSQDILRILGISLKIEKGNTPGLKAKIGTPKGILEIS